jgi:GT2 family glycosyltransferase
MLLSVIIVNYNVKYFLEQCLFSLQKAIRSMGALPDTEVFVIDNYSIDGSIAYLRPQFPWVQFIVNEENLGFSAANNQALKKASGKYILFLNPDTIIAEDTLSICIDFLQATPDAGALGVHMVDGSGSFLKESRRGFPSPWVAFCKLTGLADLFPRSRFLAGYYMGHLPEHKTHPAPVLSGAFLLAGRAALERTGGFDERFFMYAEDIDLSYRIEQAGFVNYYIADTTIVHFKGESTLKDASQAKIFYKAMSQFREKHFKGALSGLFNNLMEAGIWLRGGMTALFRSGVKEPPSPADHNKEKRRSPVWVTGDPEELAQMRQTLLTLADKMPVEDRHQAAGILFCEGTDFSFKQIIEALSRSPHRLPCSIHAAGSRSAVGSRSKDGRGETIHW